jgi:hypothetical protein
MNEAQGIMVFILLWVLFVASGAMIGAPKGRAAFGAIMGGTTGIIGCLIVAAMRSAIRCPLCREPVVKGCRLCPSCRSPLAWSGARPKDAALPKRRQRTIADAN